MNISFTCPNQHPLSASQELAGRPGQCPKCGAKFVVPPAPPDAATEKSAASNLDRPAFRGDPGPRAEKLYFVCPNGHKLKGPISLRGKPGQCPHCSARFLIQAESQTGLTDSVSSTSVSAPVEPDPDEGDVPIVEVIDTWRLPAPEATSVFPLADLLAWIWEQRDPRCVVELLLKDGLTFVVKQFAPELSRCGFGVFASTDDFGKYTLTCIAWDQVVRVMVRGMDHYPQAYFDARAT